MKVIDYFQNRPKDGDVGIEIEMEGQNLPDGCPGWKGVHDGSLRGAALEYVLENPVSHVRVPYMLTKLNAHFLRAAATLHPSDRCGVHVHINCQQLDMEELERMIALYFILEPAFVGYCGEKRSGNLFCLRSSDAEAIIYGLVNAKSKMKWASLCSDSYRYASLNMDALRKYGSLEFRSLATPKDIEDINDWVDPLMRLRSAAKEYSSSDEIIRDFSRMSIRDFVKRILDNKASTILPYVNENEITDALRRIQPFIYAKWGKLGASPFANVPARAKVRPGINWQRVYMEWLPKVPVEIADNRDKLAMAWLDEQRRVEVAAQDEWDEEQHAKAVAEADIDLEDLNPPPNVDLDEPAPVRVAKAVIGAAPAPLGDAAWDVLMQQADKRILERFVVVPGKNPAPVPNRPLPAWRKLNVPKKGPRV